MADVQICTNEEIETGACQKKKDISFYSGGLWFAVGLSIILIVTGLSSFFDTIKSQGNSVRTHLDKMTSAVKSDATFNTVLLIILFGLYVIFVVAILMIIISAYDIKNSYELGANLEKQCNNTFMEKERADFHIYSCYTETNDYAKKTDKTEAGIFSNNNGSVKDRLKTAYTYILSNIITIILAVTIIIVLGVCFGFCYSVSNENNIFTTHSYSNVKFGVVFAFQFLVPFISLVTLLVLWINGNYKIGTGKKGILLNPYIEAVYNTDERAFWVQEKQIKKMLFTSMSYIILILITVVIVLYLMNEYIKDDYKIPLTFIRGVGALLAMLCVVIPLFIQTAQKFEVNITGTYTTAKNTLTGLIKEYRSKNNNTWESIRKELENNINTSLLSKSTGEVFEKISLANKSDGEYSDDNLYMYLTHIVNKNNIIGIPIPQQIKSMIKPEYLAGERSIELKEDLIRAHKKYSDDNEKNITKESLVGDYGFLKTYLKEEVQNKISDGAGNKQLELLNQHILFSENFKKGNPFPFDIIDQLTKMRNDKTIKNTVEEYYSKINIIVTLIIIFIAYYVYHTLIYPNDVDIKIQYVSMFIFILMLILGITGWWMKEMWL